MNVSHAATGRLLEWYRPRRSAYPWRRSPPNAYLVLVSEFMLQQTQAARVAPAFRSFVRRFPSVGAVASASTAEVLRAWSGLGYNRRALSLLQAARRIVADHGGRIPSDPASLAALPGIGPYTSAAVASIAFGVPLPAIDTNVRRVVSRAMLGADSATVRREDVQQAAAAWMKGTDPGVWNQAVMDLGREVCRQEPRCPICPIASACAYRSGGRPMRLPRSPKGRGSAKAPFEGSTRQLRGAIVRLLTERQSASMAFLSRSAERPLPAVSQAVAALASAGLVKPGPAALAGRSRGRVRLVD